MQTVPNLAAYRDVGSDRPGAVTIGNFDGCHLGHLALIEIAKARAKAFGGVALAVTFSPRPEAFFRGTSQEKLLFTDKQKTRGLAEAGLDFQIVQKFDADFSQLDPSTFYETALKAGISAKAIIVGRNFRFGKDRAGDGDFLKSRGQRDGIEVILGDPVEHRLTRISSTRIRNALAQGDIEGANAMLGRAYLLEGVVAKGDQLGRQLGVPTANLENDDQIIPRFGIYAGYVWLDNSNQGSPTILARDPKTIPAVFSIGIRPTLQHQTPPLRIEAHLLEGSYGPDSLYGKRAGYYLSHFLRDEIKYVDLSALKVQMAHDINLSRRLLRCS